MAAIQQQQSIFAATVACFMAHALNTFYYRRVLGESGYHDDWMRVDRRIRFDYATYGQGNF